MNSLVRKYQSILGLNDWEIIVTVDDAINTSAETKLLYNDYKAIIRINAKHSDEEKERSLIHELIHLIYRDAYDIFTENVENEYIKEYCSRQHERAIEKTAKIIYKLVNKGGGNYGQEVEQSK